MTKRPLVTKLQLGHALGLEALLPRARDGMDARNPSTPAKQSFGDKCVPKLELGNELARRQRFALRRQYLFLLSPF